MTINSIQPSNIYNFIQDQKEPPSSSCALKIARYSSQLSAIGLALCARIPAIPISRKAGGSFAPFGWTLATVNIISYGSLIAWSFLKIIEEKTRAKTPEEKELKSTLKPHTKAAILTASVFLGVFSQIPFGYMAYEYNNNSWLMAGTILLGDSPFPIYSLILSFEKTIRMQSFRKAKEMAPDVLETRAKLLKATTAFKKSLPERYSTRKNSIQAPLLQLHGEGQRKTAWLKGIRGFTKGIGIISTFGRLLMFSALAYEGASLISGGTKQNPNSASGEAFACSIAALVAISNLYLLKKLIINSSLNNVQLLTDILRRKYKPTLGDVMRTKLYRTMQVLSLVLVGLSFSTPYQVSRDTFEHSIFHDIKIPGLEPFVVVTSTYSVLNMVSHSLRYFIEELVNKYVNLRGTNLEKEYTAFQNKITKIEKMLDEATHEEVENLSAQLRSQSQGISNGSLEGDLVRELVRSMNSE